MSTGTRVSKAVLNSLAGILMLWLAFCRADPACLADDEKLTEADITSATANLLERSQFSQGPSEDSLSRRFLDRYLDTLDGAHLLFLQSDLDEFARFRPALALNTLGDGNAEPAHVIFARYLKRLAQETDFAAQFLHEGQFDFTGHDVWQMDRHDASAPRDLAAAQALWRQEVREGYLLEKLAGTPESKIAPALARRYMRRLQNRRRLKPDDVLEIYLDALAHAYDPHSDYLGHMEAQNFKITMNLSLFGIGGTLKVKDDYCVISELIPGGPAARSGQLKPGDRIMAVAQDGKEPVDVAGMSSSQVVELIRGPKGSTVRLTVIPAGASDFFRKTVSVVRDEVKLADARAKAAVIDMPQTGGPALRIGVLGVPLFYVKGDQAGEGVSADAARLIKKLKEEGVRGLIVDLRHNGGGSTEEAVRFSGLFIPRGPVVQMIGPEEDAEIHESPEANALYDGPLVVLTSRMTASASEIVAGALQDYGRALVVGDASTFGKGTMQNVVPLKELFHQSGLGAVMVTVGKFYRPSGASTQLKGVTPDIVLPSETDRPDIGEAQLPNALPWDIVPTTAYTRFDLVRPVLGVLSEKSRARVAADPGFCLIREELAMAAKDEDSKSLTLNEAERRRAKARAEEMRAEMEKALLADAVRTPPTQYITLAEVDFPPAAERPEPGLNEDIELQETENILTDYIHALPATVGMNGTTTGTELTDLLPRQ